MNSRQAPWRCHQVRRTSAHGGRMERTAHGLGSVGGSVAQPRSRRRPGSMGRRQLGRGVHHSTTRAIQSGDTTRPIAGSGELPPTSSPTEPGSQGPRGARRALRTDARRSNPETEAPPFSARGRAGSMTLAIQSQSSRAQVLATKESSTPELASSVLTAEHVADRRISMACRPVTGLTPSDQPVRRSVRERHGCDVTRGCEVRDMSGSRGSFTSLRSL
jgi:hypothetical protein